MNQLQKRADFNHAVRQCVIGWAKHAIHLAPLPEFKMVIDWLEFYDECPTDKNRDELKALKRDLCRGQRTSLRHYGYTPVGEFYWGLLEILRVTLHPRCEFYSFSGFYFREAAAIAARETESTITGAGFEMPLDLESRARRAEQAAQQEIWRNTIGVFDSTYFNKTDKVETKEVLVGQ